MLKIASVSGSENYTRAATNPTVKWEGEADAYVIRKIRSALNESGELNRAQETSIIIPGDLSPTIDVLAGDTITFQQWDGGLGEMREYNGKAQTFSTPADLPGLPQELKIALEKVSALP